MYVFYDFSVFFEAWFLEARFGSVRGPFLEDFGMIFGVFFLVFLRNSRIGRPSPKHRFDTVITMVKGTSAFSKNRENQQFQVLFVVPFSGGRSASIFHQN